MKSELEGHAVILVVEEEAARLQELSELLDQMGYLLQSFHDTWITDTPHLVLVNPQTTLTEDQQARLLHFHEVARLPFCFLEVPPDNPFWHQWSTFTIYNPYLKPFASATLKVLAREKDRMNMLLKEQEPIPQKEIKGHPKFKEIVGKSQTLQEVLTKVNQVAPTDATVFITGETGTGKELVAQAIHNHSPRRDQPLVKLNCAALPLQLLESELFGHEKGSFTGATQRRIGKFETAHRGTVFLDEVGELPIELQAKLLRVLQEKEFERLGSNKVQKVDIRILAATNRDLEEAVAQGTFRADLYYRLNVFPLEVPPLRERKEDILPLALHFLHRYARNSAKRITGLSNASLKELQSYDWPGNVRELSHVIERAVILHQGGVLQIVLNDLKVAPVVNDGEHKSPFEFKTLLESETELIFNTLKLCKGKVRGKQGAAARLGINPNTLDSKMKKLGITKEFFVDKSEG